MLHQSLPIVIMMKTAVSVILFASAARATRNLEFLVALEIVSNAARHSKTGRISRNVDVR